MSTETHQEDSPVTQDAHTAEFIQQQGLPDWTRTYFDLGISGKSVEKRPGMLAMITEAERLRPACVVFYRLDRAFRNAEEQAVALRRLKKFGVKVLKVRDPNLQGPMGDLIDGMLGHINQFERQLTGMRIRDHNLAMAQRGEWPGGPAPFGYLYRKPVRETRNRKSVTVEPGRIEPHPVEWPIAQQLWEWALAGMRKAEILEQMLLRGWRRRQGRPWNFQVLDRFFKSRVYAGYVPFGHHSEDPDAQGEWFLGQHLPMVTMEQWHQVQAMLLKGNSRQRSSRNPRSELAGLIRCRMCGGVVSSSGATRDGGYSYTCIASAYHRNAIHPYWSRREWVVHMAAQSVLFEAIRYLPESPPPDTSGERRQAIESEIARLQNQRRRMRELYRLGEYNDDLDTYQRDVRAIDAQVAVKQAELEAAGPSGPELRKLHSHLLDWVVAYEAAQTVLEKQRLWRGVIEQIEVEMDRMWVRIGAHWPGVPTEWVVPLPPPGTRAPGTRQFGQAVVGQSRDGRQRGWLSKTGMRPTPVGEPVAGSDR